MKIELIEHKLEKKTHFGTIMKSLNQHIVLIENDEGKMAHCGYVGVNAFLPLCGFPVELVEEVANECERQLGRKLDRVAPPPSLKQIAMLIAEQRADDAEEEEEDEA